VGNKRANLSVPAGWSQQDRRFGESVKQNLDTLQGLRGDKLDRAVTFRDLLDTGLVTLARGITNFDGNASSVAVVNEVANLEIPPAPTNLQADGAFQNIILTWDLKLYAGHSFVQVWRHTSDVIASATMVAQVSGFTGIYADAVGSGKTFYYWVRAINENNIPGPFNSSTGTQGQTAVDVTHLLGVLNGAITSSELANSLTTRIDLIDAADTVVNSVAYRVAQEASARASAITAEATARANAISAIVTDIPIYDSTEAYAVDQIVRISNTDTKLYICIQAVGENSSVAITDTAYWKLYGDYAVLKSATDSAAADITEINTIATTSTSAAALAIKSLQTSVNDPSSGLSATAGALSTLQAAVNHSETGLSATVTDLTNLETALFDDLLDLAAWSNTANYAIGARVSHLQKAYKAIQASTSSAPKTPGVDTGFWALDTIAYSSAVSALSSTLTNDYVEATDFTALSTDVYEGAFGGKKWDSSTSFAQGDTVIHQGVAYRALQNNSNSAPPNSNWELSPLVNTQTLNSSIATATNGLATASDLTVVRNDAYNNLTGLANWSSSTLYIAGQRVVHTDSNNATKIYKALASGSNNDPSQNLTGSNPKWQVDPTASSIAQTELSSRLTNDYTTSSALTTLLANKEDAGTAAGLISASEASAANTYATVTNVDAQYAAIFEEMTGVDDWSPLTSYTTGARVIYESGTPAIKKIYRALQNSQGRNPASQTSYWQVDTLAYAAAVSTLETTVNASGSGLVDKVDGVELRLNDVDGNSSNVTMEQRFTAQANDIGDLEGQYTVKIDANGAVAGFGLASTSTSLDTNESEFYVNADRFAIMRGGSDTTAAVTPFVVQATATFIGGELVPAGVYMTDAFIKNGSIVAAKIADATIDNAKIANLSAEKINAGKISTSRLNIDGTTLTSINVTDPNTGAVVPTLSVNQISANKINTGTLNASQVTISNLTAATITGDINVFDAVNTSTYVNLVTPNVYYEILDQTLAAPDISHQVMASVVMQATKSQSGGTQVDMKITMTPTGGSTVTVFEGGHDHNFSNGSISQAAAGSLSSTTTTSVKVQVYAKKHGKGVVVTKIQGFIGGIR